MRSYLVGIKMIVERLSSLEFFLYYQVFTLGFSPTPDAAGRVLPDYPSDLRERGEFNKVNLMTGRTSRELATVLDLVGIVGKRLVFMFQLIELFKPYNLSWGNKM